MAVFMAAEGIGQPYRGQSQRQAQNEPAALCGIFREKRFALLVFVHRSNFFGQGAITGPQPVGFDQFWRTWMISKPDNVHSRSAASPAMIYLPVNPAGSEFGVAGLRA